MSCQKDLHYKEVLHEISKHNFCHIDLVTMVTMFEWVLFKVWLQNKTFIFMAHLQLFVHRDYKLEFVWNCYKKRVSATKTTSVGHILDSLQAFDIRWDAMNLTNLLSSLEITV